MRQDRHDIVSAFKNMTLREHERVLLLNQEMQESLILQIMNYPTFCLPTIDAPVVICGFFHALGVCTAWMVTGEGFEAQARYVLPMQRQLCRSMYEALNVHRMQLEVDKARRDAMRWAESLGFEYETVLKRAGPYAEDYAIYLWPDEGSRYVI